MGLPEFESESQAPKARRMPSYPTAPCMYSLKRYIKFIFIMLFRPFFPVICNFHILPRGEKLFYHIRGICMA